MSMTAKTPNSKNPDLKTIEGKIVDITPFEKTVEQIKAGTATATASMEQAQTQFKAKLEEGVSKAMKTAEQVTAFNKGNMDAFIKAGTIYSTGMQDISKAWAASAKASVTDTMANFKALTTVKSLKEAIDLQSSFARTAMEKTLADSGKLTEQTLKLAEQAFAPLTARLNVAVETFSPRS